MSHRRSPRQASEAIQAARAQAAPKTALASLQAAWSAAVGAQLAAVASPVSERAGEVTIECADVVWAQELEMMKSQLLERLRADLGDSAPMALRFRTAQDRA